MLAHRQPWLGSAEWPPSPEGVSLRPQRAPLAPSLRDSSRGPRRTSPAGPCQPVSPAADAACSTLVFRSASYSAGPARCEHPCDRPGYRQPRDPNPHRKSALRQSSSLPRRGCPQAISLRSPLGPASRIQVGPPRCRGVIALAWSLRRRSADLAPVGRTTRLRGRKARASSPASSEVRAARPPTPGGQRRWVRWMR